ncbi:MAG: hypothetical protein QM756_04570 [Polyangiaceae bacterium]
MFESPQPRLFSFALLPTLRPKLIALLGSSALLLAIGEPSAAAESAAAAPQRAAREPSPEKTPVPQQARQLLLVRSASWPSTVAQLTRFERESGAPWRAAGEALPVNLGRHGMAWGRGLHTTPATGPRKLERDGRSPAGVFALGSAFGAAAELPEGAKSFPYLQIKKGVACVEETRSKFYNRIVDASSEKTWERRSDMLRPDGLFRWGVVVEQNAPDTIAGAGSCVFLHIWRGPKEPTSGCTSLAPDRIEDVLRWLQAEKQPVLVQLPDPVYATVRAAWGLPE